MRKDITIVAEPRVLRGKNEARRLRARGLAPAVIYGAGQEPQSVAVSPKEVNKILSSATGHNTLFNVQAGGETALVMIVDWQRHPLRENLLHLDLKRIDPSHRLKVKVPVATIGEPRGVKEQGGLYQLVTREVEIECLPDDIPDKFKYDVTGLMLGSSLRAGDLPLSGSMKLLSSPETVISHVIAVRVVVAEETVAAEAAPAAAAEPEVIKKGKKEEEGAAAATDKKPEKKK